MRLLPLLAGCTFSIVNTTPSDLSRELLVDTSMTLARTVSVEQVFQEVTQQLRRTIDCDAVAIALAQDATSAIRLVHQSGYADSVADTQQLAARLAPTWNDAIAHRHVVVRPSSDGSEITVPATSSDSVVGAITLAASDLPAHRLEEVTQTLVTIAAEMAIAIERARLVQQLGRKRRLEAIGEMSAGVAHELRNPLFGISSAAQLLRFRVKDDPVVEKNVGRILREVERLNNVVTSLLEYGRPSPIRLEPGDPDDVWDEVIENQRGRLESRALLLNRARAEYKTQCAIDAPQLAQAFLNVLANATDAAPEGSDLTLESTVTASGGWRCRLTNGGPAIPADVLPRVFEIFFSTKPGSTGMGLALCQRIVEEHHGRISLESTPETGTTATIVLPAV